MVAYSHYIEKGLNYYFNKDRFSKCTNYIRSNVAYFSSFLIFELQSVSQEKQRIELKVREKRKQILKLHKAIVNARKALQEAQRVLAESEEAIVVVKSEEVELSDSVQALDNKIDIILKREMRALGVLAEMPKKAVVATAEPKDVWAGFPVVQQVNLLETLRFEDEDQPSPILAHRAAQLVKQTNGYSSYT